MVSPVILTSVTLDVFSELIQNAISPKTAAALNSDATIPHWIAGGSKTW
jgi:hypothetical protein